MRPLIEILEDERALKLRLESVYRYLTRTEDCELIGILNTKRERIEKDLCKTQGELREYITELFE